MHNLLQAIVWGGLTCGVLDAAAASLQMTIVGGKVVNVWRGVASALIGPTAFQYQWKTGLIGLFLHFLIAFSAASVFCGAARKLPFLVQHPLAAGPIYGMAVYCFMALVVIPLSRMQKRQLTARFVITQLLIHIFCVGLPIALWAQYFL